MEATTALELSEEDGPAAARMSIKRAAFVAALVIALWLAQLSLGYVDGLALGPLSGGLFAIGVVSFYGWHASGAGMKATITATFVTVYMALLAAFLTSDRTRQQIDKGAGADVWDNFTWLAGIVVVSYFGASTTSEVLSRRAPRDNGPPPATSQS